MKTKPLKIILLIVFFVDLFFVFQNRTEQRFFTKTLLLPMLTLIYLTEAKSKISQLNKTFIAGLIFSFLGDLFLLFNWGFLPGLGSFLLAHIFYIFCFKYLSKKKVAPKYAVIIFLYFISLIAFLYPYLNEMKIPVIVYGITISTMLYFSLKTGNVKLILGALMFVISDSVLAINLFVNKGTLLGVLVMMTYVAAQWYFVKGMLERKKVGKY